MRIERTIEVGERKITTAVDDPTITAGDPRQAELMNVLDCTSRPAPEPYPVADKCNPQLFRVEVHYQFNGKGALIKQAFITGDPRHPSLPVDGQPHPDYPQYIACDREAKWMGKGLLDCVIQVACEPRS